MKRRRKIFTGIRSVTHEEQEQLIEAFSETARAYGLQIHLCCGNAALARENVDADGCMSKAVLEKALGCKLDVPQRKMARAECACLLGADIGAYNTCGHGCLYCYANYDKSTVISNMRNHDPHSSFLIGKQREDDIVKDAVQKSWKNRQLDLSAFL